MVVDRGEKTGAGGGSFEFTRGAVSTKLGRARAPPGPIYGGLAEGGRRGSERKAESDRGDGRLLTPAAGPPPTPEGNNGRRGRGGVGPLWGGAYPDGKVLLRKPSAVDGLWALSKTLRARIPRARAIEIWKGGRGLKKRGSFRQRGRSLPARRDHARFGVGGQGTGEKKTGQRLETFHQGRANSVGKHLYAIVPLVKKSGAVVFGTLPRNFETGGPPEAPSESLFSIGEKCFQIGRGRPRSRGRTGYAGFYGHRCRGWGRKKKR